MVKGLNNHSIMWLSPSPIWGDLSSWMRIPAQDHPERPVILRFANDMFMEEMIAMLTHSPWRFAEWVAQSETWRDPMPNPKPIEISRPRINLPDSYNRPNRLMQNFPGPVRAARIKDLIKSPATVPQIPPEKSIKLYHANHQRYYVVTASLVLNEMGCPDYLPDLGKDERATFVVRALTDGIEYAFISTSSGMAWRMIDKHDIESAALQKVVPNEERLPLFPVTYPDTCGRLRRLYSGLIPVGKRDEWIDAPEYIKDAHADVDIASPVPGHDGGADHHKEIIYNDVIAPWKAMIDLAEVEKRKNNIQKDSFPNFSWEEGIDFKDKIKNLCTARDEIQTGSWYILLDLAKFLRDRLPDVWKSLNASVTGQGTGDLLLSDNENELVRILLNTKMDSRLFICLAIENLAVGGFDTDDSVFLWTRLTDFWRIEIYLKLSSVLYKSEVKTAALREKVSSNSGMSLPFKQVCISFIDAFQAQSSHGFFNFALQFGERYPVLKSAVINDETIYGHTDQGRLVKILKEIELPEIQLNILSSIGEDLSGATDIKRSMWGLLSFYWRFESYIDKDVLNDIYTDISGYLSRNQFNTDDLNDRIITWFYNDNTSGGWYSFMQFANDLEKISPTLHVAAMYEAFCRSRSLDAVTNDLRDILSKTSIPKDIISYTNPDRRRTKIISSLAEALVEITGWDIQLEQVDTPYDRSLMADPDVTAKDEWWPDFLFPLTDPEYSLTSGQGNIIPAVSIEDPGSEKDVEVLKTQLDELANLLDGLVRAKKESSQDNRSASLGMAPLLKNKDARFVVRFIFERPQCGILFQPIVSQATCRLEMAPFMDPDAPARAVRIHMPVDISPAGLRKFKKNAMFLFSDMMCGKIKKIRKLTLADLVLSVLPWPFHKDLPNVGNTGPCRSNGETMGLICSLSIPIVTLCAMILLFIMVNLLNIFFKWIPWFFICFPLPGLPNLKAKD